MDHFIFHAPTKIIFGKNSELQCAHLLREFGAHKVLVHYGGNSALRSGLLHRICQCLQEADIPYVTLGGVKPNPQLSKVREGIALAQQEDVDFLLAVGGGSVIDSAKAIAYGCANEGDVWEYYAKKKTVRAALPVGCVATMAAAGSEMSNSSVITNEDGWLKRGLSSSFLYVYLFESRADGYGPAIPDDVWMYRYPHAYPGALFHQGNPDGTGGWHQLCADEGCDQICPHPAKRSAELCRPRRDLMGQ